MPRSSSASSSARRVRPRIGGRLDNGRGLERLEQRRAEEDRRDEEERRAVSGDVDSPLLLEEAGTGEAGPSPPVPSASGSLSRVVVSPEGKCLGIL